MAASFLLQKAPKGRCPEHTSYIPNCDYDISLEARPELLPKPQEKKKKQYNSRYGISSTALVRNSRQ